MPQQEEDRFTGTGESDYNEYVAGMRVRHRSEPRDIVQRFLPVPINGSSANGFYVGTARDPWRYSLGAMIRANEKKGYVVRPRKRMPTPSHQFREEKEDQEEGSRSSDIFCNGREFTTFFFDEEMHLLTNEIAMADRYNELMKYEHLDTPIMEPEPIANYENLMPGRHRRSGNERVHPCNLHTAFSRSNPNLNINLPSWIDIDPTGENRELNYWQEQINNAYVEATKEIMIRERLFRARQLELDILEIQRTAEARKTPRSLSNSDEWLGSQSIPDDKDYPLEIFDFSDNELDSNSD